MHRWDVLLVGVHVPVHMYYFFGSLKWTVEDEEHQQFFAQ